MSTAASDPSIATAQLNRWTIVLHSSHPLLLRLIHTCETEQETGTKHTQFLRLRRISDTAQPAKRHNVAGSGTIFDWRTASKSLADSTES